MYITFRVDQAESLRRGVDAPSSTVRLDINPATLAEEDRVVLHQFLKHGHDCTDAWSPPGTGSFVNLSLPVPTIEGLAEALHVAQRRIAELEGKLAAQRAAEAERNRLRQEEVDREIDQSIAERATRSQILWFSDRGEVVDKRDGYVSVVAAEWPAYPHVDACGRERSTAYASPEARQRLADAREAVEAQRADIVASLAPQVQRLIAERRAVEEANRAAVDALYRRLPQPLRERDAAGFADEDEVELAMRRIARKDAGYERKEAWKSKVECVVLTDSEFARLREIQASAPPGATVMAVELRDGGGCWRQATEDDDPATVDNQGEVWVDPINPRRVALVEWKVGSFPVNATERLS